MVCVFIHTHTQRERAVSVLGRVLPLERHSATLIENPSSPPLPILKFSFLGSCFLHTNWPYHLCSVLNRLHISWKGALCVRFFDSRRVTAFEWGGKKTFFLISFVSQLYSVPTSRFNFPLASHLGFSSSLLALLSKILLAFSKPYLISYTRLTLRGEPALFTHRHFLKTGWIEISSVVKLLFSSCPIVAETKTIKTHPCLFNPDRLDLMKLIV